MQKNEIKPNIPNEDYQKDSGKGSTFFKMISEKSLLHATSKEWKETESMKIGTAVHMKLLEPELFDGSYACNEISKEGLLVTADDLKRILKEKGLKITGKKDELIERLIDFDNVYKYQIYDVVLAKMIKDSIGKIILNPEQLHKINAMVKSVNNHQLASKMLSGGQGERSYFTEVSGVRLKTRPDYENNNSLIDIKTCMDASPDGFQKAVVNFGYHLQASFYLDIFNKTTGKEYENFYFIAVENSAPYAVAVYSLDKVSIDVGRELYRSALAEYVEYLAEPDKTKAVYESGYDTGIVELQIPQWSVQKAEMKLESNIEKLERLESQRISA